MALPKLESPVFELNLPSTGKKIKFRPFLVKEHKVLLTMSEAENEEVWRIIRDLVDVCTFNKLNVDELAHFDIEFIFLHLRAKSIGEQVDVILNCECGNKIETSYNIEDVKIEKKPDHSNKIQLNDTFGVEMKYPTLEKVIDVFGSNNNAKVIELILESIKGIYDTENYWDVKDHTKEELEEFVFSLTKQQFEKVEEFFVTAPKVVQTIEADCPKCGKHNVSKLEGLQNFFV
jgi:hypothetical protein